MPFFVFKSYQLFYTDSSPSSSTLPVLAFIPGWTASGKIFASQITYFTPHYRVLTLDILGHGQSDRPAPSEASDLYTHTGFQDSLIALLQHLNVKTASLVGWSLGSQIAMLIARRRPELVSNLVLTGASPLFIRPDDTDTFPALSKSAADGLLTALDTSWEETYPGMVYSFFAEYTAGDETVPGYIQAAVDDARDMGGEVAGGIMARIGPADFRSWAGEIKTRTLIIAGGEDHLTPPAAGEWLRAHLGGKTEMIVYEEAGHTTFAGPFAPKFNSDVTAFLQQST